MSSVNQTELLKLNLTQLKQDQAVLDKIAEEVPKIPKHLPLSLSSLALLGIIAILLIFFVKKCRKSRNAKNEQNIIIRTDRHGSTRPASVHHMPRITDMV